MANTTQSDKRSEIDQPLLDAAVSRKPSIVASLIDQIVFSPFLLGFGMTYAFYTLIPHAPICRDLLIRYCCGHPIEYATITLFFVSMAILIRKSAGLFAEHASLRRQPLPNGQLSSHDSSSRVVDRLRQHVESQSPQWKETIWGERLRDIVGYLRGKLNAEGLEDHLRYLSDMASDRIHASYALVRTITWGIPILGFLGTVIGITVAISNVTPEQLDQSLDQVTSGLGVAFDTTALSLSLSLVMVFCTFIVEGAEQSILLQAEELSMRVGLLFSQPHRESPLLEAEADAAALLREQTSRWLASQGEIWDRALDTLRTDWSASLVRQRERLEESLEQGLQASLEGHVAQIQDIRVEFLDSLQQVVQGVTSSLEVDRKQQSELLVQVQDNLLKSLDRWQEQTLASAEQGSRQLQTALTNCTDELRINQERLAQSSDALAEILSVWKQRLDTLDTIESDQRRLLPIQEQLTKNLETVKAAESLEKTLHGLTAAVHLLTMKSPTSKAA